MRNSLVSLVMLGMALAGTANAADEDKVEPAKEASAAEPVKKEEPFKPPPGCRQRKRGEFIVYCRKEPTSWARAFRRRNATTRKASSAMLVAQQDDRDKMDQMRRICAGDSTCGSR